MSPVGNESRSVHRLTVRALFSKMLYLRSKTEQGRLLTGMEQQLPNLQMVLMDQLAFKGEDMDRIWPAYRH